MQSVYWIAHKNHTDIFSQGYIGISKRFSRRLWEHQAKTQNSHLKNAITKYGWDNLVKKQILLADEQYCLDIEKKLRPNNNIGWNIVAGGGMPPSFLGIKRKSRSKEVIEAHKAFMTGRKLTEQHKAKISKGMVGRVVSDESRKKISIGNKNRPLVKCHHCSKMGDIGSMTRWHMNNCKFKEHQ